MNKNRLAFVGHVKSRLESTMSKRSSVCIRSNHPLRFGEQLPANFPQAQMIAAAEHVVQAAREVRSVDAERVLRAVLELLKAANGESTPTG